MFAFPQTPLAPVERGRNCPKSRLAAFHDEQYEYFAVVESVTLLKEVMLGLHSLPN
jgi:hypothetical protein